MDTRRSMLLPLLLATAALAAPLHAEPPTRLLPAQSEVGFVTKQMGVPVEGRFKKFDAQINLDPKKPEAGSVALSIDTASAALGVPETDAEMPKAIWFNVARFPHATFKSSAIKGLGNGRFEVAGKLDIKGHSRDVVVPVQIAQSGTTSTASGSFVIKRLDFRIGEEEWTDTTVVANDVTVRFKLALAGLGPL